MLCFNSLFRVLVKERICKLCTIQSCVQFSDCFRLMCPFGFIRWSSLHPAMWLLYCHKGLIPFRVCLWPAIFVVEKCSTEDSFMSICLQSLLLCPIVLSLFYRWLCQHSCVALCSTCFIPSLLCLHLEALKGLKFPEVLKNLHQTLLKADNSTFNLTFLSWFVCSSFLFFWCELAEQYYTTNAKFLHLSPILSQTGRKEKGDPLNSAIDKMTKKTRDLRRQVSQSSACCLPRK